MIFSSFMHCVAFLSMQLTVKFFFSFHHRLICAERAILSKRNQIFDHFNFDMFERSYISNVFSVDDQTTFLKKKTRFDHIVKFRSVSTRRIFDFSQKLSFDRTINLLNNFKFNDFHRHLCELKAQNVFVEKIQIANRQFRIHRQKSKRTAAEKWKKNWLDNWYQRTIQFEKIVFHDSLIKNDRTQTFFRIMLERTQLIKTIASDAIVTKNQIMLIVQNLFSLCQKNFEIVYCSENAFIDQSCLVCYLRLSSKAFDRSNPIHYCRLKTLKKNIIDVNYCFICYCWFQNAFD